MRTIHILLAEDDSAHQFLLEHALTEGRSHVTVTSVRNADQFREQIRESRFDCVVTDYRLSNETGTTLLNELFESGAECPAVVVSSCKEQQVAVESLRSGSLDFVPKSEALKGGALWQSVERAIREFRAKLADQRRTDRRHLQLTRQAERDPLTGLCNRRCLDGLLTMDRRRVIDRRGDAAIVMADLDHFKDINDQHGHLAGDRVLQAFSRLISDSIRPCDIACRWGGEEFLIIMPDMRFADAVQWAEAIRRMLRDCQIDHDGTQIRVTASFGLGRCAASELSLDVIQRADAALYVAKQCGRNRVCTEELAAFQEIVWKVEGSVESTQEKLFAAIAAEEAKLGPTQIEHLTDHSKRVSDAAVMLGKRLGFDRLGLRHLRTAGLCHDLGKLVVPEAILAKPAKLDEVERQIVERHADDGAAMTQMLGADDETIDFVRLHHLRFNEQARHGGNGRRLLGAQVLSVADAFVAMTTNRSYQSARSTSAAIAELERERGSQFAPDVVDAASVTFGSLRATDRAPALA